MLVSDHLRSVTNDHVLAEAIHRCNRSNGLHWVAANISHPGEPVPPNAGEESLVVARGLIRRGLDESAIVHLYRIGQDVAWQAWMRTAFALTADLDEVRELLDVSARSLRDFIDATIAGIYQQIQTERYELIGGLQAERRQIVTLILEGAPISRQHSEGRLGYRLDQTHTAAVIWADELGTDSTALERATEAVMRAGGGHRPLSVLAGEASRWVWVPGADGLDLPGLHDTVAALPGVRVAVGSTSAGIDGFRRSHLDAVTTQRMMMRLGRNARLTSFTEVELAALLTADPERADRFINRTLGDFASADAEHHRTVLTFIREQCNASRAAARLFTHRNTLLRKLARADEMLPRPLEDSSVDVAVALEALSWRGVSS